MDYTASSNAVSTTAAIVLTAAEFDREVILNALEDYTYVGFDATNMSRIPKSIFLGSTAVGRQTEFVLPAGKDLWAKSGSGTNELNVIAAVATATA